MKQEICNQELFDKKLNLLGEINYSKKDLQFNFSCSYHGIHLNIHTNNLELIKTLEKDLPLSWQIEVDNPYEIYLIDPRDLHLDLESWTDESSQDCFYLDEGNIAIQRDFASKELGGNKVVLITEAKLTDGLYNFLRWFLPRKLLEKKSYILHSSCLIGRDNKAYLFLGHSGAGKTTITSFADGRIILGDDMNLIRLEDGKLFAQAGAIGGFFRSDVDYDKSFEVKAMFWLNQSNDNSLEELSLATGLSKLMASYANLFWESLPSEDIQNLFDLSANMVKDYSIKKLSFKKDMSFWELLDES